MSMNLRAMSSTPYASNSRSPSPAAWVTARAHASEDIPMPAYWVARSKINDPVEYKKYTDLVPAIIAKFGGKVLARGGRYQVMEGPAKFHLFAPVRTYSQKDYHNVCSQAYLAQRQRLQGPSLGRRVHRSRGQAAAAHL